MKKLITCFTCLFLILSGSVANAADSISEAFTSGKAHLNFRYRLETVDQDGLPKDATASTLRTRLNFKTDPYKGFNLFVEMDDVTYLGDTNFANFRNDKLGVYPVVADPKGTDINQVYFDFKGEKALFRVGRQRINMDNQRFIGGVGWRQNEQTYDSANLIFTGLTDSVVTYTYTDNVSRIFGPEKGTPAKDLEASNHTLHYKYSKDGFGSLVGYGYLLDFDDAIAFSTQTFGLRYAHSFKLDGGMSIPLVLEYADQEDYGDSPRDYSADYYVIETGLNMPAVKFGIGYEVLGGNASTPGEQFITPLATLHKFQGWADKFLATPNAGIEDLYFSVKGKLFTTNVSVIYHDFSAEDGAADYGNEIDIAISRKFSDHWSVLLKYARYSEDGLFSDTDKLWLMVTAKF